MEKLLPATLEWEHCPCGSKACRRSYPANLGVFYEGSGFEPHEREALDAAWNQRTATAELVGEIAWAIDTLQEINPSNYDHDDVCALNTASVEVILGLQATLAKHRVQP